MHVTVLAGRTEWSRFTEGSIERRMLTALGDRLGAPLRPKPLMLPDGSRVEVEGIDAEGRLLVQLVSNQGACKPAYRNKVMADMFKLLWPRDSVPTAERAFMKQLGAVLGAADRDRLTRSPRAGAGRGDLLRGADRLCGDLTGFRPAIDR